jgi:methylthioribose-1-phosphate isomerase
LTAGATAAPVVVETLGWRGELPGTLELIDQRELPARRVQLLIDTVEGCWDAIKVLAVRGAPAIGVAAAYGVVLGAQEALRGQPRASAADVRQAAITACDRLATSRPTAVNLFWALERMRAVAKAAPGPAGSDVARALLTEARAIHDSDRATCRAIGRHGHPLLKDGARVLTHCNAGSLATGGIGTALGVIYAAVEAGKKISVFSCETRPLLQGARLTSWELQAHGVPVTLMTDGMGAFAMQRGKIDAVIVGADRIARNGDAANKIGTYAHAVAAREHGIPFYVAAPRSTFDLSIATGAEIPIEERSPDEVTTFTGKRVAPEGVAVWNPAFDVTPAKLITALITEHGLIRPPSEAEVLRVLGEA